MVEIRWFVAHTRPRCDKKVVEYFERQGIATTLPCYDSAHKYRGKTVVFQKPLFPGYVFLKLEGGQKDAVRQNDHVANLLDVFVQDTFYHQLKDILLALESNLDVRLAPTIGAGMRVMIKSGPLQGIEGLVEQSYGMSTVLLRLDFINQAAAVVVAVSEESKRALETVCGITRPIVALQPPLPDPSVDGWHRPFEATRRLAGSPDHRGEARRGEGPGAPSRGDSDCPGGTTDRGVQGVRQGTVARLETRKTEAPALRAGRHRLAGRARLGPAGDEVHHLRAPHAARALRARDHPALALLPGDDAAARLLGGRVPRGRRRARLVPPATRPVRCRRAGTGYRLGRGAWGKGFATEGAMALLEHGFMRVGTEKISARTLAGNQRSRRVMEKCGLTFERAFVYPEDVIAGRSEEERAALKYSITRPSWLAQRA